MLQLFAFTYVVTLLTSIVMPCMCRVGLLASVWGVKRVILMEFDPIKVRTGQKIMEAAAQDRGINTKHLHYETVDLMDVSGEDILILTMRVTCYNNRRVACNASACPCRFVWHSLSSMQQSTS